MNLELQKRLAAKVAKTSVKKIKLNTSRVEDIKEAITKSDVRSLISDGAINVESDHGVSRFRARARTAQRRKGRQSGPGRKKGKEDARLDFKSRWVARIRCQRAFLRVLQDRIDSTVFKNLMGKVKGGFFRSLRHIKLYLDEHKLVTNNGKK